MDKRFPFTYLITWNLRYFHLLRQVTIETPNYPGNYPDKAKCNWKIKVPANEEVHIWCETFDLVRKDFLRVRSVKNIGYSTAFPNQQLLLFSCVLGNCDPNKIFLTNSQAFLIVASLSNLICKTTATCCKFCLKLLHQDC